MRLSEVLPKLAAKFQPGEHKERPLPGGAGTWWYIPWTTIRRRLNEVVADDWSVAFGDPQFIGQLCYVRCTLTICGCSRQGIGAVPIEVLSSGGKNAERGNAVERAIAESFKNAAEFFEIAAYLDEQADDRTKREFANYMAQRGNAKPAEEYKRQNNGQAAPPRKSESTYKPFGQSSSPKPSPAPRSVATPPQPSQPQTINEGQRTRLWTIARLNGFTDAGVKALIEAYSFQSTKDITIHAYDGIVEKLQDPDYKAMYNEKGEIALMNAALANGAKASP